MFWIDAKLISLRRGSLTDQIQQLSFFLNMFGARSNQLSKMLVLRSRFSAFSGPLQSVNICDVTHGTRLASCRLIHARLRYAAGTELFVQCVPSLFRARYARVFGLRSGGVRRSKKGLEKLHFTPFHDIYMTSQQIIQCFSRENLSIHM